MRTEGNYHSAGLGEPWFCNAHGREGCRTCREAECGRTGVVKRFLVTCIVLLILFAAAAFVIHHHLL